MSEVVSLRGGPVAATREVRQSVVDALTEALERAHAGDLQAIGLAWMDADNCAGYQTCGLLGGYSIVGAAHIVLCQLTEAARQ